MPEEQAFSVLVRICFEYKVRDLFKPGFEDLHLKFYQLERLMEVGLFVSSICYLRKNACKTT
jgi:hypothetical protein